MHGLILFVLVCIFYTCPGCVTLGRLMSSNKLSHGMNDIPSLLFFLEYDFFCHLNRKFAVTKKRTKFITGARNMTSNASVEMFQREKKKRQKNFEVIDN